MEFQDFIDSNKSKKPNADIVQRWESRVVPRSLHQQGAIGAKQYLADYGKGIAAPKVIMLARQAEILGYTEMALEFWKKAYALQFGVTPSGGMAAASAYATYTPAVQASQTDTDTSFPANLQPGHIVPMQPEDAKNNREYYIQNSMYWGQAKRDGNKVIAFASPDQVYYQSRSMKLRSSPGIEFDLELKRTAAILGSFILEGELYYMDVNGKEHRTSAQAATANIEAGQGAVPPKMKYAIFAALWREGHKVEDQRARVIFGEGIGEVLRQSEYGKEVFEILPCACGEKEKRALADKQKREGREGEIWFHYDMDYRPDKRKDDYYVRTKYTIEVKVRVTGLTPTSAAGRPFGAIEVASLDGKPLGAIGTGFTLDQMHKISKKFKSGEPLIIPIVAQGYTEKGNLFQGRLSEDFD